MNSAPRHIDSAYERELQTLRERILVMAGRVEVMIRDSASALERGDQKLAEETIAQDSYVNSDEVEIDELCLKILARRQPLASDLRNITLTLKMVTDLERISDLAVNICERTLILGDQGDLIPHGDIKSMATTVQRMVRDAIDAFVERDISGAEAVIKEDDAVDEAFHR
ncbi:MAG: phosphate signaling complex protein PhoU, partial [Pseudomonadota bacterium]|nr:phosphate signaling complex protein PhoU [Pseudomonadota bacterium]